MDVSLPYWDKLKNFGLTMNSTLRWCDTVVGICKKVFASVHTLKRMQHFCQNVDRRQREMLLSGTEEPPHTNYRLPPLTSHADMQYSMNSNRLKLASYRINVFKLSKFHITYRLVVTGTFTALDTLVVIIHAIKSSGCDSPKTRL
ncbi:hypothetical protein J6590_091735 [Homalodisca vitripennis]|nr:hypothetical protein J6590_091735 [Homalodisca vitripennis]